MQGKATADLCCYDAKNNLIMIPDLGCIHSSLLHTPIHAAAAQFLFGLPHPHARTPARPHKEVGVVSNPVQVRITRALTKSQRANG